MIQINIGRFLVLMHIIVKKLKMDFIKEVVDFLTRWVFSQMISMELRKKQFQYATNNLATHAAGHKDSKLLSEIYGFRKFRNC